VPLISGTKVEKLCPKPIMKARKDEERIGEKGCFVLSSFRVFVIKNKIGHNSTAQKYEGQISNF